MDLLDDRDRPSRSGVLPIVFACAGLVSLLLGYVGLWMQFGGDRGHPLDLLYYDIQLFVMGSAALDEGLGGPYPWPLEIARFTAPAVTVYAFVEAGRQIFASEVQRVKARRSRQHTIVCGDGLVARTIARRLVAAGRPVVTVSRVPLEPPSPNRRGLLRVVGDARDPDVLRAAGIQRAVAVYACAGDSATNTAIALAAARTPLSVGRPELAVYARVADPDLCLALQARYLSQQPTPGVRLDFFNVDDLAARRLLTDEPPRPVDGRPPRVAVLGATAFGRAVLVELARRWRVLDPNGARPLPVTLVDAEATRAVNEVEYRYPFLREVCDISVYEGATPPPGRPPDRVFVCFDDEELALRTALTAERLWHGGPRSVTVRLDRLTTLSTRDDDELAPDQVSAALHLYGAAHSASDPALIADDVVERLARAIHDAYLVSRRRLKRGHAPGDPSLVPWERLEPWFKQANRGQAKHIGRALRSIHCVLSPRVGPGDGHELDALEIERLAQTEHQRWVGEKERDGWRYARSRDDALCLHPALVPWNRLPEQMRQRNREAVRQLPAILADAGFRIVRLRRSSGPAEAISA